MKNLIILLILIALLVSCKKNTEYDQFDKLTKSPWQLSEVIRDGEVNPDTCELDDKIIFKSDTYLYDQGVEVCLTEGTYKEAKWKFLEGGSQLKLNKSFVNNDENSGYNTYEKFDIIVLNDTMLKLKNLDFDEVKIYKK